MSDPRRPRRLKIELHLLQNFAPSCLNRDDTNTPKDCYFGGVRRARISSQCLKRTMRTYWRDEHVCEVGTRSKRLKDLLTETLGTTYPDLYGAGGTRREDLSEVLGIFLAAYYSKLDTKRPDETAVLLYISAAEARGASEVVHDLWEEVLAVADARDKFARRKAAKETKREEKEPELTTDRKLEDRLKAAALSPDIALFGRMLAEKPDRNVDAACQVAHAISTHAVSPEMDFYTAVDDLNTREQTGAGMMGVIGFQSACFYRYHLLDLGDLAVNLGDAALAEQVAGHFLKAAIYAIPSARQNSMAAHNLPSFGLGVVRDGGVPISLANAFAQPVRGRSGEENDLVSASVQALSEHWGHLTGVYGTQGVRATPVFAVDPRAPLNGLEAGRVGSVEEFVKTILATATATRTEA